MAEPQPVQEQYEELTKEEEDEIMAEVIQDALQCPCVKDLRASPCGNAFEAAFTCFHMSREVPKGSECVEFNQSFASCLNAHPEAIAGLKSAAEGGLNLGFPEPPPGMHYHNHYHHPPPRHQPPHK